MKQFEFFTIVIHAAFYAKTIMYMSAKRETLNSINIPALLRELYCGSKKQRIFYQ